MSKPRTTRTRPVMLDGVIGSAAVDPRMAELEKRIRANPPKAFRVTIPLIGRLAADSIEDLSRMMATARDASGYGASDIGGQWNVLDAGGRCVAKLSYNGRIWR